MSDFQDGPEPDRGDALFCGEIFSTYAGRMKLERLTDLLGSANRIVAFTGAGISTESGIPDFRSAGGIWTKYDPRDFTFDRYVEDPSVRERSWQMRHEFVSAMPEPNSGHRALAALEKQGRLAGVITQNIDGLHQLAGSQNVIEIHGNVREVECIGVAPGPGTPRGCGFRDTHEWALERIDAGDPDPMCPDCGGIIKTATISFGQMMPAAAMDTAYQMVEECDLLLVLGSSLEVYPAAGLPAIAQASGARVVIINRDPTDQDDMADLVINEAIGEILPAAIGEF